MTIQEMQQLKYGDHVTFRNYQNRIIRLKINGAPKVWKTRPNEVRVPVKYGLYEYGYITESDADNVIGLE